MSNNITRETYIGMPDKDKLNVLYDISTDTSKRVKDLEKRKRYDTTFAGFMGLLGGAFVMTGRWVIGK